LISRQKALFQGLARYFTGKPCKHGHIAERYTGNKTCCVCANAASAKAKDPKKVYEYNRHWRQSNPKKSLDYTQKYVRNNKDKRNLWTANYRQAKRTPAWLIEIDYERIANVYKLATLQSKITGTIWHVDHIIPLRGKYVCGLHVPSNLQAIPGVDNVRKNNSYGL